MILRLLLVKNEYNNNDEDEINFQDEDELKLIENLEKKLNDIENTESISNML